MDRPTTLLRRSYERVRTRSSEEQVREVVDHLENPSILVEEWVEAAKTVEACLEAEDKICPGSTKCVDIDIDCYDKNSCASDTGFICESDYAEVMNDYKTAVSQHNELAAENAVLREQRLEQKNCVINAETLKIAIRCVRQL